MTLAYAKQLGFQVRKTDVGAQKIDGLLLRTFGMVIAGFQVEDKLGKARFFQIFSFDLAMELPENTGINKHAIKLQDDKQPPYGPIYSLRPIKLEILKIYIKTHFKTGFIRPSKSPAGISVLFDKKPDGSLW